MEKFVSSWSDGKTLPETYVFPHGKRPGERVVPTSKSVPVIDLSKAEGLDRERLVQQIMKASQEFGFFQVINHGVPRKLMDDARGVLKEFFELPAEEKSTLISSDLSKKCLHITSNIDYDKEEIHNWRDSVRLECAPLEQCLPDWPHKPTDFRDVVGAYIIQTRDMGMRILNLVCEGLGLEQGYFANELSQGQALFAHHYPPCPDPSLTLGTRSHCDTGLITILLQGNVPGLQVKKDEEWVGVEAIPDAFVVNLGYQLQIVSNGKLASVEHRAVTNKNESRISAAFFLMPTRECLVEPAKAVINAENPPIYKAVQYAEFLKTFRAAYIGGIDNVLEPYMIKS